MAATKSYAQSLMTAALSLPGIALGQTALESTSIEFKHLVYDEDDLMKVDADYLFFGIPLNDFNDIVLNIEYETISGASPIYMSPRPDGTPVQVVSGASITDERTAASVRYRHIFDGGSRILVTPGTSDENDYISHALTLEYQWDSANNNTSFSIGGGLAEDKIFSVLDTAVGGSKDGTSLFFGVTRILTTKSLVQFNVSFAEETGYLSDPYKLTLVEQTITTDNRPREHARSVFLGRYIRHLGESSSVHLSYRYHDDDWSVTSHTLEGSWYRELNDGWLLSPTIRYYSQDRAEFYEPYFVQARPDGFHSSDYRLAGYGSLLTGVSLKKHAGEHLELNFALEHYRREGDLKLRGEYSYDPHPLSSLILTFGLGYTF